jgi:putative transposase
MPEHVHLLVSEPQRANLSIAIQALKLGFVCSLQISSGEPVVVQAPKACPEPVEGSRVPIKPNRFWMARFYDFNVWTEKKRIEKLRYIHRNPVARGLVTAPEQWPWTSFRWYSTGEVGPVKINDTDILVMKIRPPAA